MASVFLVSSSPARRAALRRALESDVVRVVGEADVHDDVEDAWAAGTVLLLDGDDALDAADARERAWPSPVVWIAGPEWPRHPESLARLGAAGWAVLSTDADATQLKAAVVAAAAGLAALPIEWAASHAAWAGADRGDATDRAGAAAGPEPDEEDVVPEALTEREIEVLAIMARGLSNREIGARLGISEHTAKFHVASVLGKLGAHNRADAVRRGIRRGLLTI